MGGNGVSSLTRSGFNITPRMLSLDEHPVGIPQFPSINNPEQHKNTSFDQKKRDELALMNFAWDAPEDGSSTSGGSSPVREPVVDVGWGTPRRMTDKQVEDAVTANAIADSLKEEEDEEEEEEEADDPKVGMTEAKKLLVLSDGFDTQSPNPPIPESQSLLYLLI